MAGQWPMSSTRVTQNFFVVASLCIAGLVFLSPRHMAQHGHGSHNYGDSAMPMYFIFSTHATLWFRSWETTTLPLYLAAVLGLFVFGILHEVLASLRSEQSAQLNSQSSSLGRGAPTRAGSDETFEGQACFSHKQASPTLGQKMFLAHLYAVNLASGYLLMLAVMTYNIGFILSVILGMATGYFVVYDRLSPSAQGRADSCHVRLLD